MEPYLSYVEDEMRYAMCVTGIHIHIHIRIHSKSMHTNRTYEKTGGTSSSNEMTMIVCDDVDGG